MSETILSEIYTEESSHILLYITTRSNSWNLFNCEFIDCTRTISYAAKWTQIDKYLVPFLLQSHLSGSIDSYIQPGLSDLSI